MRKGIHILEGCLHDLDRLSRMNVYIMRQPSQGVVEEPCTLSLRHYNNYGGKCLMDKHIDTLHIGNYRWII